LEACPSLAEHVGPCSFEVNIPGYLFIGLNLVVTTQAQLGVVKDSTEATHQIPTTRLEPFQLTPELQGRKWVRIDCPAQDSFIKSSSAEVQRE